MSTISQAQEAVFQGLYAHLLTDSTLGPREKAIKIAEHLYGEEGSEDLRKVIGRGTLARFTGISEAIATRILKSVRDGTTMAYESCLKGAIAVEDFIEKNDVTLQVRKGLEELTGSLIPDMQFRDALGISPTIWAQIRERSEFSMFQVTVRKTLYWANPKVIDKVRGKLDYL